jgi:hypothetical protein
MELALAPVAALAQVADMTISAMVVVALALPPQ